MQELVREYLNELSKKQKKRRKKGLAAVLLIVLVVGGVIGVLTQYGVAMTGDVKCGLEEHTHTEACYTSELVCGLGESEGHVHTEACYYPAELVCGLEETEAQEGVEGHTHTEACYAVPEGWACGQEESEGHTHTEACYENRLSCGLEEHIHTDLCYIDTTADVEDASVWDTQYANAEWKEVWSEDLAAAARLQVGYKESADNYTVTEDGNRKGYTRYGQFVGDIYADWDAAFVNFCMHYAGMKESGIFPDETDTSRWVEEFGKLNEQSEKYEAYMNCFTAAEGYTPEIGDIVFFQKENEETTDQMGIVSSYDEEQNEIKVIEGNSGNEVKENAYEIGDTHIVCYLMTGKLEEAYKDTGEKTTEAEETTDTEGTGAAEETAEPEEAAEDESAEEEIVKTYTADTFTVTAAYKKDANIPEEAEFIAEEITKEEDKEHYEKREAESKEMVGNKKASIRALLKVGFYVDGKEVEPESPVTITIQFLDEAGLKEGKPITVIHFADEGTEKLDGGKATDNSTTFQMESFSEVVVIEDEEIVDGASDNNETVYVSESFEYEDEAFRITFQVDGNAILTGKKAENASDNVTNDTANNDSDGETEGGEDTGNEDEDMKSTGDAADEGNGGYTEDDDGFTAEGETSDETDEPILDETNDNESSEAGGDMTDNNESGKGSTGDGSNKTVIEQGSFRFEIVKLEKDTEKHQKFSEFAAAYDPESEELLFHVMEYKLFREDEELDLTNCKVTVAIRPVKKVEEYLADAGIKTASQDGNVNDSVNDKEKETQEVSSLTLSGAMQTSQTKTENMSNMLNKKSKPEDDVEGIADNAANAPLNQIKFTVYRMTSDEQIEAANDFILEGGNVDTDSGEEMNEGSEGDGTKVELDGTTFGIQATETPDRKFTVQYYANLQVIDHKAEGVKQLDIIDTSNGGNNKGGNLPQNGKASTTPKTTIAIKANDLENAEIVTKTELTKVYKDSGLLRYYTSPSLFYFNALKDNPGYELKEVWILKDNTLTPEQLEAIEKENGINKSNWDRYWYDENLHFTNRKSGDISGEKFELAHKFPDDLQDDGKEGWIEEDKNSYGVDDKGKVNNRYVLIDADNKIIRLIYDTTKDDHTFDGTNFYDYDISNGEHTVNSSTGEKTMYTAHFGINSSDNYKGSGVKYAFGNQNAGTDYGKLTWDDSDGATGNLLNAGNNQSFGACTFKLVSGMKDNMTNVQFSDGINGITNLFGGETPKGKRSYSGSLGYTRNGDTYTLTTATVNQLTENGSNVTIENLDKLPKVHDKYYGWKGDYIRIWSNSFWPMDQAGESKRSDFNFGETKDNNPNAIYHKYYDQAANKGKDLPLGDDFKAHNSYFGMRHQITFKLPDDYVGPLNYYFFGDDDMWVFLSDSDGENERLICDIGGVHSSAGEYVDLWDYIPKERTTTGGKKEYKLTFFYTERGASGSTCWMQFTLPEVTSGSTTSDSELCELKIMKEVEKTEGDETVPYKNGDSFEFKVKLWITDENGNERLLPDDYSFTKYQTSEVPGNPDTKLADNIILHSGGTFDLEYGQYVLIKNLPPGVRYEVIEKNRENRRAEYNGIYYACATDISGKEYDKRSPSEKTNMILVDPDKEVKSYIVDDPSDAVVTDSMEAYEGNEILYVNRFTVYKLPATGGPGSRLYVIVGSLCVLFGAGLVYRRKYKEVLRGKM